MNNNDYANLFKVLSDPNRIKILQIIHDGQEVCVCKILEQFNITQPTFSYHMKMLTDANLVQCRKIGTSCHYRLNYNTFNKLKSFFK
jgi:ArsR family transcriptional regulator, arsenate/arsenite/antimonite-responsive transcriptional repressor